ncbi:SRPBCC family protein [Actinophytocola gossypii]|uniref:SRPBCC family protein n=1 Tax=Actinophytocola gossypii TaxID=2812003 RepID=A0ABT2JJQ7_9PSEU|nr:SRPBCC family protein [Actinophytocola gossypii]MCT2587749.1 SRPBCC family protein [Actinophytocola gossypii]
MTEVSMTVATSPDRVFDVLADGWLYVGWVVGAAHIRDVDPGWPAVGTRLHHSVGPWPFLVHDTTTVRALDRPRTMELDAGLWPFGAARVRLELTETDPGTTEIRMIEQVVAGPGRVLPEPVQALLLVPRNRESLRRLADLAVGREEAGK